MSILPCIEYSVSVTVHAGIAVGHVYIALYSVYTVSVTVHAGIAVGHVYYFLEDVFPAKPGGFKILKTPAFL